MKHTLKLRGVVLTAVAGLSLTLAACGSDTDTDTATPSTDSSISSEATETTSAPAETTEAVADAPFGPACADVPTTGEGSVEGMANDPVATAASNNPLLSTLVAGVTAADLVGTLNDLESATVFAPANSAFEALPAGTLDTLLLPESVDQLTSVLTYHVIPGMRLAPEDLAGTFTTAQGGELTIEGSGEDFTIGDGGATVLCGNVQTANATVYIIDQVLTPPAS